MVPYLLLLLELWIVKLKLNQLVESNLRRQNYNEIVIPLPIYLPTDTTIYLSKPPTSTNAIRTTCDTPPTIFLFKNILWLILGPFSPHFVYLIFYEKTALNVFYLSLNMLQAIISFDNAFAIH